MHSLFAGLMGLFMGIGAFFHGGAATHHLSMNAQATVSGAPQASPSGTMRGRFMMKLPAGERPFFGTVTTVNGSTVTITMMRGMRLRRNDKNTTNSTANSTVNTTSNTQTVTITLDSSTKYTGGSQADIKTSTRIAGIGKTNSDGSLTAVSVSINPTFPSGMPRPSGMFFRRGTGHRGGGQGFGPQQ